MAEPENIIVEMIPVGNFIKVSAVCERTGTEVSIVGDPKTSKSVLEATAVKKLRYVMSKKANSSTNVGSRGIEV